MKLTEQQITDKLHDFIRDCDADDLAKLAGDVFGGKCFFIPSPTPDLGQDFWDFDFTPDENYMGAFGEI